MSPKIILDAADRGGLMSTPLTGDGVERARRESPFGGPIAHGYLPLSLIPRFLPQRVQFTGFSMGVNYGAERVHFPSPVRWAASCAPRGSSTPSRTSLAGSRSSRP